MKTKILSVTCLLAALFCIPAANAAVIMTLEQVGSNVVATDGGTVNLAGLSFIGSADLAPFVDPSSALLLEGNGGTYDGYRIISGPAFGPGGSKNASSGTGDPVGIAALGGQIVVPTGYTSGNPLSSTATWDGQTLATLGVTPGIYTYTWGCGADADSLTLYAGVPVPTPEPAPALLFTLAAAALALFSKVSERLRVGSHLG